jgi:dienelactone hydrolase
MKACTRGFWVANWVSNENRGKFPAAFAASGNQRYLSYHTFLPAFKRLIGRRRISKGDTKMRHKKLWMVLAQVVVVALSGVLGLLELSAASQDAASAPITIPTISAENSPLEPIGPVAEDGYRGMGFLRKPPGNGPFPAVVLIHGGLGTLPNEVLARNALTAAPSRFLASGYVVVVITYRSRNADPQSKVSLSDSVAAVTYLRQLRYVDPKSIVIYGSSGGGDLALEVAAATDVAAIAAEEPATVLFTGILNKELPKNREVYTPGDAQPIVAEPKRYYTSAFQQLTREKIARIRCPMLIMQGDQEFPINRFNAQVFIPEVQSAGKNLEVITYPGELHGFAFRGDGHRAAVLKAFQDMDAFFRRYLNIKPKPLDPTLIKYVSTTEDANLRPLFVITLRLDAQTQFAGVWKTDAVGGQGVSVDLNTEGTKVMGAITLRGQSPAEIHEAKIDEDTLIFKARSPDGSRTVTFSGKLSGDQITFTHEVEAAPGAASSGRLGIFGPGGPPLIIVQRVQ